MILTGCLSVFSQIECTNLNVTVTGSEYKFDADGDGVKDFWFHPGLGNNNNNNNTGAYNKDITGQNGSEIEVDAANGKDANRLEQNHQIGNNFWNDTAYLTKNGGGNFSGGNSEGYVGLRHFKNGNYYYCYVQLSATNFGTIDISNSGYNTTAGGSLKAGECPTTAISDQQPIISDVFVSGNHVNVLLPDDKVDLGWMLQVLNTSGQTVQSEELMAGNNKIELNHFLNHEICFVVIKNKEGFRVSKKIFLE
jgi:hypothetical protein